MRTKAFIFVVFFISCCLNGHAQSGSLLWYDGTAPITYSAPKSIEPVVKTALGMFAEDMQMVTGKLPQQVTENKAGIRILQYDKKLAKELAKLGAPVDSLAIKPDAFFIKATGKQILVVGSNARGTAYGILELSRMAGVSPWVWWGDSTPQKQNKLTIPANFTTFQAPSVEYRGIFLNDEDWSLQPWSWKHFDPQPKDGLISAKAYKEVFKLLMRLRANAIWPAMHGVTVAFYKVPGAKEAADECGIVIGTSHCEPLMRNNVGEWDENVRGHFNFIDNHDNVIDYWTERLKQVHNLQNIYTIGMRGIHDGSMEGVKTMEEKTTALQKVIYEQRELLGKYVNKDVTKIPQQFVPYKEVLEIYENGLDVPEDITLTWCDDNYGYLTRLSNTEQQKRSGGAGVYYHLSYWGRPHDYLWLTATQPGLIYNEMREAYNHNAKRLWIVNVHDIKPAIYHLEFFLDLAWNINSIAPSTVSAHRENWLKREFGTNAAKKLYPAMLEFDRLAGIRRPEFMGWSKVEEDKAKYKRGWTPVVDTDFSLTEFGGELDRYLSDYDKIKSVVATVEKDIPAERKDAFFAAIKYPVFGAAAMATKQLEAQRARSIAAATPKTQWNSNAQLVSAAAKSTNAYNEIQQLTDYYNNTLAGGKWKYSMNANPRDLPVFEKPTLPELSVPLVSTDAKAPEAVPYNLKGVIAKNASQYTKATKGAQAIQSLGHSMKAVALPKDGSLVYEFDADFDGPVVLRTALIPTQPNDKGGDLRFSVQIDNETPQVCSLKEPFRSETWKKNVLRGQAVKETKHSLTKGKHKLTITALDNHIVVDQWMLDTNADRQFYVFPVSVK
ncbi:hypothetical protein GR160_15900 [Flavobacterium sp. Sd200]|nr:hypothetical protein [Flavobacterium sp. Sd200]